LLLPNLALTQSRAKAEGTDQGVTADDFGDKNDLVGLLVRKQAVIEKALGKDIIAHSNLLPLRSISYYEIDR
jgi:hypothetical protein